MNLKASKDELTSGLAVKANVADLEAKANITDVNIKLAEKISVVQFEEGCIVDHKTVNRYVTRIGYGKGIGNCLTYLCKSIRVGIVKHRCFY
nr:hypothetical protein [Flavobacterium supellecticarium]